MVSGILTILNSASVLGASQADENYDIMEFTSACCAVVTWTDIEDVPNSFGDPMGSGQETGVLIETFIRDVNDPTKAMRDNPDLIDKVINALKSDSTLQGSVDVLRAISATRTPQEVVSIFGHTWIPTRIKVIGYSLD